MSTGGRKENCASTKDMHYVSGSTAANFELRKSISAAYPRFASNSFMYSTSRFTPSIGMAL